ncbi:MAG TPA: phospholipase D-like domain-containing protein, partial [Terriglobales bacterium]
MNNRTHRELLIVDGRIGFIGGAGIADHWMYEVKKGHPRWRDTMVRVEGDVVSSLQATFAENWCEAAGEILTGPEYWPGDENAGHTCAMVINGAPNAAAFTRARVLFQCLMASAKRTINVTTPYFLPDASMLGEMAKAIRERGVRVRILVPGNKSDHALTRTSSRLLYGDVLKAGAEVYEYQRSMIHAKILIVDGLWSVVGSTNCDPRSFGLNDEVNMAVISGDVARQLTNDFENDIAQSKRISYEEWKRRGLWERLMEMAGWLIRKQQ